jgi:hypothetical protein
MRGIAFVTILALFTISQADAHPRHHHHRHHAHRLNPIVQSLGMGLAVMLKQSQQANREGAEWPNTVDVPPQGWPTQTAPRRPRWSLGRVMEGIGQILPHPSGCPSRAFCGCGAASYLGIASRDLWLAANWFRFPRAAPGPGMAAVRRHHVMAIVSYEGGDVATVYDANSGHHMTRIHRVSLRGYTVVNPHGRKYARL